jgi:hypothetical protein
MLCVKAFLFLILKSLKAHKVCWFHHVASGCEVWIFCLLLWCADINSLLSWTLLCVYRKWIYFLLVHVIFFINMFCIVTGKKNYYVVRWLKWGSSV